MARILIVGPHPDDQELGMGGTIIKLAAARARHFDPWMSPTASRRPWDRHRSEKKKRPRPCRFSKKGATGTVERWLLDLPNRFVEHTIENRHALAGVIRAWQATVIFTTFDEDAHPDHRAVTRCIEDARFDAKLSKIEMPAPIDAWTGEQKELGPTLYPKVAVLLLRDASAVGC